MSNPKSWAPVSQVERIGSLDVLRGFALLGILVVNIQSFSMVLAAYSNPTVYGDLAGINFFVWLLTHGLFDQKLITIFSMLFGAGIFLMNERAEVKGRRVAGLHYRRMFWLIVIGAMHAYLLWCGDILVVYGMCGLIVFWFRNVRPRWQLFLGLVMIGTTSANSVLSGWSMPYWPQEQREEFTRSWDPSEEAVQAQVEIYRGGWIDQMAHRAPTAFEFQTFVFLVWGFWRLGGLMLVGMALFQWGVFSAQRSPRFYRSLIGLALVIGLPVVFFGAWWNWSVTGWDLRRTFFYGVQFNYWGSILVSLGYVGIVMLMCQNGAFLQLQKALAAVGQTALSNYLLQSIMCTTIFYGHGFGLFGHVERVGQVAIVLLVWMLQLIVSPLWLARFRFGPIEWLWRSLSYHTLQPFRRAVPR